MEGLKLDNRKEIKIYDPALCCPTGLCGVNIDPELMRIAVVIETLKKNYTIVIVTHNMQQATRVSDYTAFFMLGELVEFNTTNGFFSHPKEKKSNDYITGRFS